MHAPHWRQRLAELDPPVWLLLALVAAPLALGAGGAAPPWPGGVAGLTSLAAVAAVVAAARMRQRHPGLAGPLSWRWAVPVLLVSALLYLLLLSRLSFAIPGTDEVGVKGLVCTAEARLVFTPECPGDDLEALRSAEYEATRIWQSWSVDLVRLALLGSWALAWAALCTLAEDARVESFEDELLQAPPWPVAMHAPQVRVAPAPGRERVSVDRAATLDAFLHGLAATSLLQRLEGCSLWSPHAGPEVPLACTLLEGLPTPDAFAELLTGRW